MSNLPWVVVYGAWIWPIALGLMLAGALATAWFRPRWLARRQWRRALRGLGEPVHPSSALDGKEITLVGQLRAQGSCERFEDGAKAAASRMDDPAALSDLFRRVIPLRRVRAAAPLKQHVPEAAGHAFSDSPSRSRGGPVEARGSVTIAASSATLRRVRAAAPLKRGSCIWGTTACECNTNPSPSPV